MKKLHRSLLLAISFSIMLFAFSFCVGAASLPTPQITEMTAEATSISFSWTKSENADGYVLYLSENGGDFTCIAKVKTTYYTSEKLSPNTRYSFRTVAYKKRSDGSKIYSEYSETVTEKTKLASPSNLTCVSASSDSITLKWDAVTGAESYKIQYCLSGKSGYKTAGYTADTSYKLEGLSPGLRYKIKVIARCKGNTSHSSLIKLYTVPGKAEKPVIKSRDGGSITLEWAKYGMANTYYVYVATSADGKYKRVGETEDTVFTYQKKTPKKSYYFKVVPVVKTDLQLLRGQSSDCKKGTVGNITIECPDTVRKGEYPEITVPYYNSKVKWSSSDKSVIKVQDSRLFAVGKGTVTLTATYKGTYKAKVKVKVLSPTVSTMSAVYNVTDKEYMYQNRINERCYPASITKLITALVALKYMDEDDIITVGNELNMVEAYSSRCDIKKGEKYRLGDLLYGLLLPSGGDAAYTIAVNCARKVSGNPNMSYTQAKNYFVSLMNKYMKAIGATGTHCVNPHGYPVSGHYSTVHDLVLVARKVLKNDTLKRITSTPYKYVTALTGEGHSWSTTNSLIKSYSYYYSPYAHGMKTGTVDDEYTGIISAATKDGKTIITVVIGCESYNARYEATHKLLGRYL